MRLLDFLDRALDGVDWPRHPANQDKQEGANQHDDHQIHPGRQQGVFAENAIHIVEINA